MSKPISTANKPKQCYTVSPHTANYTVKDVQKEIKECQELLKFLGYPEAKNNKYEVYLNPKKTGYYGICEYLGPYHYKIILNASYLKVAKPKDIHNTIMHEMIHSLRGCFDHGKTWQSVGSKVNKNFDYAPFTRVGETCEEYEKLYKQDMKWKITCNKCGNIWYRKKESTTVKACRIGAATCLGCGSKDFKVERLK